MPAVRPAPGSTTTSCSAARSRRTTSGTSATRRSSAAVSMGTPILKRSATLTQVADAGTSARTERERQAATVLDGDREVVGQLVLGHGGRRRGHADAVRARDQPGGREAVLGRGRYEARAR